MENNSKYVLAGGIIAGFGTFYAIQNNFSTEKVGEYLENNKEEFLELIEEIVQLSLELLEKFLNLIKKLILSISFKIKMICN